MPGRVIWFALALWLGLLPLYSVAAAPDQTPPGQTIPEGVVSNNTSISPIWKAFSQTEGLISNNVTAILVQDRVIWFSTDAGISRFDGGWSNFESATVLPPGRVTALVADQAGAIWMGTSQGHIARWHDGAWQPQAAIESGVRTIAQIDDILWVGADAGIYVLDPALVPGDAPAPGPVTLPSLDSAYALPPDLGNAGITALGQDSSRIYAGTDQGLWAWDGEGWTRYTEEEGLPSRSITAIWAAPQGTVWVGTQEGAARWMAASGEWYVFLTVDAEGNPAPVRSLQGDEQGSVWAASESGAYLFTQDNQALQLPGDVGLTTSYVQAIAPDRDGYIWLGTVAGVFRYSRDAWIFERRNDAQPEADGSITYYFGINYINALLVDSRDGLWMATNGAGVRFKAPNTSFSDEVYYTQANSGLPSGLVRALAEDAQGDIWAGTEAGLARFHDGAWRVETPAARLPAPRILSLAASPTGLWIGTEAGLAFQAAATGQLTRVDALAGQAITALALDAQGKVWVGTRERGIFVEQPDGSFAPPPVAHEVLGRHIVALASDQTGRGGMWVGVFQQGISYWDGQQWQSLTSAQGLPSSVVHTVYTAPGDLSVWIGSEAGVTRFDRRSWGTFGVQEAQLSPSILAVARSQNGGFWFGGRDGLTFYHPDETPPWVRIQQLTGLTLVDATPDFTTVTLERSAEILRVVVTAGDLHTAQDDLTILYRWSGPQAGDDWQVASSRTLELPVLEPGAYELELGVRDEAFNYAPFLVSTMTVRRPPTLLNLPLIGPVGAQTFQALLALTVVALAAFAYVSNEIVQARRRVRDAMVRGYNPYISGEPVRREDMFFGREELLQRIIDTLHNNSIMIHGERRIGKTTLLYQLGNRLREVDDQEFWFVPTYADLEGTTQEIFFHFLMEEILTAVDILPGLPPEVLAKMRELEFFSQPADTYSDRHFSRDLRQLLQLLDGYGQAEYPGRKLRLILLLDEMDVMSHYDHLVQQQLRRIFMREFATNLGAVVAGIQISKAWDRVESPWYNLFNEIELEPFNREQAAQLLTQAVRDYYVYDQAAVEAIVDHSDGRPFRLQQYGLEAVSHMLSQNRRRITLADVEVAHQRIQDQISKNGNGQPQIPFASRPGQDAPPAPAPPPGKVANREEAPR